MSEKYNFSDSSSEVSSDDDYLETEQNKKIKKNNLLLGKSYKNYKNNVQLFSLFWYNIKN